MHREVKQVAQGHPAATWRGWSPTCVRICVPLLGAPQSPPSARSALSSLHVVSPLGLAELQTEDVWLTGRQSRGPNATGKGRPRSRAEKGTGSSASHGEAFEPRECAHFGSNVPSTGLAGLALKV